MSNRFSSGKHSIAECDRCGFQFKLRELRKLIVKTKQINEKVCNTCWEPDQPQLQLGMYPISDPQAVMEPRPDNTYYQAGNTGLQLTNSSGPSIDADGTPSGGSRQIQWGWNPVGMAQGFDSELTPNDLVGVGAVGTVTVVT